MLLVITPYDDQAWLNLGYCYEGLDRPEEAIEAWKRAARIKPDMPASRYSLVATLRALGRSAEAAPYYEQLLALDPQAAAELDSLYP